MKLSTLLAKRRADGESVTAEAGTTDPASPGAETESADEEMSTDGSSATAPDRDDTQPDDGDIESVGGADTEVPDVDDDQSPPSNDRRLKRVLAFVVVPLGVILLAGVCGYLKWQVQIGRDTVTARMESTQAAKDSTIALLSYGPDTVEQQLTAARNLLTGTFRDSYTTLTRDVVIPSAKQKQISAAATVSAVASVSATPGHAVALVFVDQTTIVGNVAPTGTSSVVRVSLDEVDGKWLISSFDPV